MGLGIGSRPSPTAIIVEGVWLATEGATVTCAIKEAIAKDGATTKIVLDYGVDNGRGIDYVFTEEERGKSTT